MGKMTYFKRKLSQKGYLLPITIALGLGVSTVSILGVQVVSQNSSTLNNQYYTSLAKEAARAGTSAAANCLRANNKTWSNNSRTLTPATGCDGVVNASRPNTVATDQYVQSTYIVDALDTVGPNYVVVTSTGKASIKGPGGIIVKTFSTTIKTYAKTSSLVNSRVSIPIDELSVGDTTACVVADAWPYCWGSNVNGMLGTGSRYSDPDMQATPSAVASNSTILSTPNGPGSYVCDLIIIVCITGHTEYDPPAHTAPPSQMINMPSGSKKLVSKISVGTTHVCAVAKDSAVSTTGKVYCWGNNDYGQLGNKTNVDSLVPVAVDTTVGSALAGKSVVDVTAGNGFTCALDTTGNVYCWGDNTYGQLGTENTTDSNSPKAVSKVSASVINHPAVCTSWFIVCLSWSAEYDEAIPASSLYGKTVGKLGRIQGGSSTICVIDTTGQAHCWGNNSRGQIGDKNYNESGSEHRSNDCVGGGGAYPGTWTPTGTLDSYITSKPVATLITQPFDSITTYASRTVARTTSAATTPNRMYYWSDYSVTVTSSSTTHVNCGTQGSGSGPGGSGSGKWINGRTMYYDMVTTVPTTPLYNDPSGLTLNQKQISLSGGNAYNDLFCAVTGPDVYCDPHTNAYAQGQTGSNYTTGTISGPQHVYMDGWLLGKNITAIGVGSDFGCILANSNVGCWGLNTSGQVGDNTTTNRIVPTPIDVSTASDIGESATISVGAAFDNPISF